MDDDSDLSLNIKEFKKGIHDYGLIMEDNVMENLFQQLDKDNSGALSFDEFLTALRVSYMFSHICIPVKAILAAAFASSHAKV